MQAHDSVSSLINNTIEYQWLGKQDLRHACFENFQIKFLSSFEPLGQQEWFDLVLLNILVEICSLCDNKHWVRWQCGQATGYHAWSGGSRPL